MSNPTGRNRNYENAKGDKAWIDDTQRKRIEDAIKGSHLLLWRQVYYGQYPCKVAPR